MYNTVLIDLHMGHSIIRVPFMSIDDYYFFLTIFFRISYFIH